LFIDSNGVTYILGGDKTKNDNSDIFVFDPNYKLIKIYTLPLQAQQICLFNKYLIAAKDNNN